MATIVGTNGNDGLTGGAEDDVIFAEAGTDTVDGGAGNDVITTKDGGDTIDGGAGIDQWTGDFSTRNEGVTFYLSPDQGATTIGSDGTEVRNVELFGLLGGAGNDRFVAGDGSDGLYGRAGNDLLQGGGGNDYLSGDEGADQLSGGAGDDQMLGGAGDDLFFGDAGANSMAGGAGANDIANYNSSTAGVVANLVTGGTGGDAAGDTYFEVEGIFGTEFRDVLTGNEAINILAGFGGNDILEGGAGVDVFYGGPGSDTLSYAGSDASVLVSLLTGASGGHAQGDTWVGIENLTGSAFGDLLGGDASSNALSGGRGDDGLAGGGGADTLQGGVGIDRLEGEAGDDTLQGGAGADALDGGDGIDTVSYSASAQGVRVSLGGGTVADGDAAGDTFNAVENLTGSAFNDSLVGDAGVNRVIGGAGRDALAGAAGDDRLEGGDGNDVVIGGAGKDVLVGGAGADTFDFNAIGESLVGSGRDTITDFTHLSDRIDLATIDANAGTGGDQAFSFIGSTLFTGAAGDFRVSAAAVVMGDVNGDGAADFQTQLTSGIVLSAADFVL